MADIQLNSVTLATESSGTVTLANAVQDNVTRLGTVTAGTFQGTLNSSTTFPTGHIIKVTTHLSTTPMSTGNSGTFTAESDANDAHVTCVAGNKLHITIMGGSILTLGTSQGWCSIGMRIIDSGTTDVNISSLYNRALDDYKNDSMPCMMYTHTAVTTSVIIKRFVSEPAGMFDMGWYLDATSGVRYLIMEEQV